MLGQGFPLGRVSKLGGCPRTELATPGNGPLKHGRCGWKVESMFDMQEEESPSQWQLTDQVSGRELTAVPVRLWQPRLSTVRALEAQM